MYTNFILWLNRTEDMVNADVQVHHAETNFKEQLDSILHKVSEQTLRQLQWTVRSHNILVDAMDPMIYPQLSYINKPAILLRIF